MPEPRIKGSAIAQLVEDVRRLRDEGRIPADELSVRLDPAALELLERKPQPALWYPIESYQRLTDLLWDLEGRRSPDYLRRRGAATAERLIQAGLYAQLSALERCAQNVAEYLKLTRRVATLMGAIYDFARITVEIDPGHPQRIVLDVDDAGLFSDAIRLVIEGFFTRIARERGLAHHWVSERTGPTSVLFRMDRDLGS
jgi:hypothetical protein